MEKTLVRLGLKRGSRKPTLPHSRMESRTPLPRNYEELFKQSLDVRGRPVTAQDMLDA